MPSASVTVRIDENLKKQAEVLFNDMGLNMTTAFNLFIKAVVRQNKIPFEITANPLYGESNRVAFEELQRDMAGEAERVGWSTEEDVIKYCREVRNKIWENRHENND